jgi:hypothetical protein
MIKIAERRAGKIQQNKETAEIDKARCRLESRFFVNDIWIFLVFLRGYPHLQKGEIQQRQ